ncbi:EF-hand domain-containing protein [Amycolatopsis sp. cg5]|uniref:EF-hand domain-containing protein n=1 Tax=Amycolatopsis sp. cg5 TaxID=3238802 RepID=UPI0035269CD8
MTTAIRNDRLQKRFEKWDVNGNGVIERDDYAAEADRIISAFSVEPSVPAARSVREAFLAMFDFLAEKAKVGPKGTMNQKQFIKVVEEQLFQEGDAGFSRVLRPTISAIVGLCDADGDGMVSPGEFRTWMTAIGVEPAAITQTFAAIDKDGDGQLSVEELVQAVRDYHFGALDVPLLG